MSADPFDHRCVRELFERAQHEVHAGRLPSCQLAIARGQAVVTAAFGDATTESRYVLFSLTKALVAGAVWALMSDGSLRADTRVADVVPEFGANGKQDVTVEHLLTHTAGFPDAELAPEEAAAGAARATAFARWPVESTPGSRFTYHAVSAHWVLAEMLERLTGDDYRAVIQQRVTGRLRLRGLQVGVPAAEQRDILPVQPAGAVVEDDPWWLRFNEPDVRALGVPGAGGVGVATQLARYFQFLLHGAAEVWDDDVLTRAARTVHCRLDHPETHVPANRSLGLVVAGDDGHAWLRGFGHAAGPRTFGHTGAGGQIAWADPDSGLSFCFLTNGIDADEDATFARSTELSTLAGRCATPA